MPGQHFPLLPLLFSAWFHALVLSFPVSSSPWSNVLGNDGPAPLDVRFRQPSQEVQTARMETAEPQDFAAQLPDAAPGDSLPPVMPEPAPLAILVPDRYLSPSEVDQKAAPLELAPLIYPEEAYLRRIGGKVMLRLFISETGSIDGIDILVADPPLMFDQAAVDAVMGSRFRAARLLSRPVKSVKTIWIQFDPLNDR